MLTLNDTLNSMTVDELKRLLPFVPDEQGGARKAEIIKRITNGLLGNQGKKLILQYEQLDKWQKLAVAEALYDPKKRYRADEFRAKYQQSATLEADENNRASYSHLTSPSRLRLFFYNYLTAHQYDYGLYLPIELVPLLNKFVAKPAPASLPTMEQLPEPNEDEEALQVRLCEQEALADLPQVFNLVQQGKLKASAKTSRASAATIKLLAQSLNGGDFYDLERPKACSWSPEIGGIKAFAWPLILQAAKLAQVSGSKMELSRGGTQQLAKPVAETLRQLWQKWLKTTLLDEFCRIEAIKGQKSKGRVMTAIAPRRLIVASALRQCPVDKWVDVDDFFNFMRAARFQFEIAHDLWKLYLVDREYGTLGYTGYGDWPILQGRYVLCLLFEYAATLGIVDVAFIDPDDARNDYLDNWGADELEFLSRYDGLRYFRLTALGAYCLGLTDEYQAPVNVSDCRFCVLPSLHIKLTTGKPSAEDQLVLDTWATQEAEGSWKLDKVKTILALERGYDIAVLETFLQGKDDQLLPETVEGFINKCRKQSRAIKQVAVSLLLECSSEEIAVILAEHKETCKLCQRVGKKQLVVKQSHEEKFRRATRIVGYGMTL